jgi:Uncharacterized conserved protein
MKFVIKQRVFSFGDSFVIKDEMENERYIVRGQVFSFGDKLTIYDMAGNEVVYIEQKLFRFLPEYDIYLNGQYAARVKKEFTLFSNNFDIDSTVGQFTVEGDFFGLDFTIYKNGSPSAYVSKQFFSWSDTYGVDIMDGENEALILALVIVIDQVVHDNEGKR